MAHGFAFNYSSWFFHLSEGTSGKFGTAALWGLAFATKVIGFQADNICVSIAAVACLLSDWM
jgi:hypothetical protein